ncbi:hypothetical protein JZ751_029806, partial [Albula glossodonta]
MPFSTACNTPLSNFESHQNYKVTQTSESLCESVSEDVQDPSVIVNFPLVEDENISLIAWTTTPWTLPSNLALCVNPEFQYVKVKGVFVPLWPLCAAPPVFTSVDVLHWASERSAGCEIGLSLITNGFISERSAQALAVDADNTTEKVYIMMEARLGALFKTEDEYTILDNRVCPGPIVGSARLGSARFGAVRPRTSSLGSGFCAGFPGKTLKGKKYKPLFEYFLKKSRAGNCWSKVMQPEQLVQPLQLMQLKKLKQMVQLANASVSDCSQCKESGAFAVVMDNYVPVNEGQKATASCKFDSDGSLSNVDDYRVCMDYDIIQKDSAPICPVDASGCFTADVTDFVGQYVKVSAPPPKLQPFFLSRENLRHSAAAASPGSTEKIRPVTRPDWGASPAEAKAAACTTPQTHSSSPLLACDADKNIIKLLKERGRLVNASTFKHSYPFCWRSDTPLIYKAVPSWFVRVEHMVDKLLDNNGKCYWVPEFVREKRFGNWLRDARDWAVSRNRYWGTPIPLWVSDDFEEVSLCPTSFPKSLEEEEEKRGYADSCVVCVGSVGELEELTGGKVTDLHRESIDHLTIPSCCGKGELRRVTEVFDCWFESGSMPYAQVHYPFENRREFEDTFPADFIAEGIDQTRGWFYTLLVLSTALFGKPPFKNVIVNGLVLASDGQKMSKRKKNYPDPGLIVKNYGADALRLYLINSPVVRAENLRFKEEGVRDVLKDVFLPWYNAYRFLVQNVQRLHKEEDIQFLYNESTAKTSENIMDKWIQSFTQSLIQFFKAEMDEGMLDCGMPSRSGENGVEDCVWALETLYSVLFSMCRLMAPFTPFITEMMYQNLKNLIDPASQEKDTGSIHYLMLPQV